MNPWPRSWPLRILAAAWSSVSHVVGAVIVGVLAVAGAGWRFRWGDGAFDVVSTGWIGSRFRAAGWAAQTWGIWILCWQSPDDETRRHERRHLWQTLVFGPLFPIGYLLASGWRASWRAKVAILLAAALALAAAAGMPGYEANPFERDARRHELAAPGGR